MSKPRCLLAVIPLLTFTVAWSFGQTPPKFEVQRATYEAMDGSGGADVTERVKAMVRDGRLTLDVTNRTLGGDPTPNRVKQLRVEYTLDGKPQVAVVKENGHLDIPPLPPLTPAQRREKAIAALKSDASLKEKCDACRELAVLGDKKAIPALAALLGDEKLSHMARYGLETIPDPAVDEALRDCLSRLKGRSLVGVIHSLGVRRDAKAVEPLCRLLLEADADVVQAAARALGKIGGPAAAKALSEALTGAAVANRPALCEGLLQCAEQMAKAGQSEQAIAIYDRLRAMEAPPQVRTAALRGAILVRQKDGLPVLMDAIRSEDFILGQAAAHTVLQMPGGEVTQALAAELPKLPAEKQVLLMWAMGKRADAAALPALLALCKTGQKMVRLTAIRALPQIGSAEAAPTLQDLLFDADPDIAQAAQESLAALPGNEVDGAILSMLNKPEPKARCVAIGLIGRRRAAQAVPALLKATEDADEQVRTASLKVLGELSGPSGLPALIGVLLKTKAPQDTQSAESALAALCARAPDPAACAGQVLAALAQAQGAHKLALLRILRTVGGSKALEAVRSAAKEADPETRETALRVLCEWPSVDALPDVAQLAKTSADAKIRILALRGYVRLIPQQEVPPEQKLAALKEAMSLATRNEEKKLALAALGNVPTGEALNLVTPFIADPNLKEEACLAAVGIAENAPQISPAQLGDVMEQILKTTNNEKVRKRARTLLDRIKKTAPMPRR